MASDVKTAKSDIFGIISAYKTLLHAYPKIKVTTSFPSISMSFDQIEFIVDLFTALGSIDDLISVLSNIIINQLEYIERAIKEILKQQIKDNISCNVDPSVLRELYENGIDLPLKTIDIFNLMRKSPKSSDANLFYFDTDLYDQTEMYKSTDFNAFLWYVINLGTNNSTEPNNAWGVNQGVSSINLAQLTFNETSPTSTYNNVVNFKINKDYVDAGNKLTNFNSDFIDSVKLFDKKEVVANIFGKIFGSLDFSIKRTQEEILLQDQINEIINKITNENGDTTIDDSYFSFSNDEYNTMLEKAELKKKGLFPFISDTTTFVQISTEDIMQALNGIDEGTLVEQEEVFTNAINTITDMALSNNSANINPKDKYSFKVNLIKRMITELSSLMTLTIVSPKLYILLAVNLKLLGIDIDSNIMDFIKKNFNLVSGIVRGIKDQILDELFNKVKDMAIDLSMRMAAEFLKNQARMKMQVITSLTGNVSFMGLSASATVSI